MRRISEYVLHATYQGSSEDAHGNEIELWGSPVQLGIYAYNPATSSEVLIDGHMHRVQSTPTIYLPSSSVVGNRDLITARGEAFTVDGDTAEFRNPFDSSMDGNSINLKAVSG